MSLAARFPNLAKIPRVNLVDAPTPVERLAGLSDFTGRECWVKRDDRTSNVYGGNKTRKLAFLLGDAAAQRATSIVTMGALGSHHVLATATHAPSYGLEVHALLAPQPWSTHVEENLRAALAAGAKLHRSPHAALSPILARGLVARLRRHRRVPYVIPHGGSTPVGTLGYVEAGIELALQIEAGELPEPEAVYVALGSGATAVGLALGFAATGLTVPVIGVRVTSKLLVTRHSLDALLAATFEHLRGFEPRFPSVVSLAEHLLRLDDSFADVGYGVANHASRRALELADADQLVLDVTYTAPALAVMIHDLERGARKHALYWHTLSSADLSSALRRAPFPPRWARGHAST